MNLTAEQLQFQRRCTIDVSVRYPQQIKLKAEMEGFLRRFLGNGTYKVDGIRQYKATFGEFLASLAKSNQNVGLADLRLETIQKFLMERPELSQASLRGKKSHLSVFLSVAAAERKIKANPIVNQRSLLRTDRPLIAIRPDYDALLKLRSSFDAHVERLIDDVDIADGTVETYKTAYREFLRFLEKRQRNIEVAHVDRRLLEEFFKTKRKHSRAYVDGLRSALSGFFDSQVVAKALDANPLNARFRFRRLRSLPTPIPEEKLTYLLSLPDPQKFSGLLSSTALQACLSAALRISEARALRWEDLNPHADEPYIQVTMGKGSKPRQVPLEKDVLEAFDRLRKALQYAPGNKDYIFVHRPWSRVRLSRSGFAAMLRKLFLQAGLEDYRFHQTRHTAASRWLAWGIPPGLVRELLGHSSFDTTKIYTKVTNPMLTKVFRKAGPKVPVQSIIEALKRLPPA